jgi:hypothetical protein
MSRLSYNPIRHLTIVQKESVLKQQKATKLPRSGPPRPPPPSKPSVKTPPPSIRSQAPGPTPTTPRRDVQEEKFWTTPAQAGRALRVSAGGRDTCVDESSLLLDENSDLLGDVSLGDMMSPVPTTRTRLGVGSYDSDIDVRSEVVEQGGFDGDGTRDEKDGDDTIVLSKTRRESLLPSPPLSPSSPQPPSSTPTTSIPQSKSSSKSRVRINAQTEIVIVCGFPDQ